MKINKEAATAQIEIQGISLHNQFGWLMEKIGERGERETSPNINSGAWPNFTATLQLPLLQYSPRTSS